MGLKEKYFWPYYILDILLSLSTKQDTTNLPPPAHTHIRTHTHTLILFNPWKFEFLDECLLQVGEFLDGITGIHKE